MGDQATSGTCPNAGEQVDREKRTPWVLASVVPAGVALVAGFAIFGWGSSSNTSLRAQGAEINNAEETLAAAEALARRLGDIGDLDATTEVDAARTVIGETLECWFSYPGDSEEPNPFLRCGPIYLEASVEGAFWLNVPVTFTVEDDQAVASVEQDAVEPVTHELEPNEDLIRPDSERPPTPDEIAIEPPPLPIAEAAMIELSERDMTLSNPERPHDGRIHGASYRVEVSAFGFTERTRLDDGTVYAAAEGEEWLVAELAVSPRTHGSGTANRHLDIDGETRTVSSFSTDEAGRKLLVASVPTGSSEIALIGRAAPGSRQGGTWEIEFSFID